VRIALIAPLVTVIREPQAGGSQAFLADLARGLTRRGHDVDVWAASGSAIAGVNAIDTGFKAESFAGSLYRARRPPPAGQGSLGGGKSAAALEDAFREVYAKVAGAGYDVVHNHAFDAPAIRHSTSLGGPVVHTLHLPPDTAVAAALREARSSKRQPTVAAVSRFQLRAWSKETVVDLVLTPGIPTARIPWSGRADSRAVFAGRFSPEKGAAEAIDIAVAAGIPIDFYGDPYDITYAEERIYPRRQKSQVEVHDSVDRTRLWQIMSRASVVLFPAMWDEPFGMVAAEAQAAGTPVVGFRRGALPEVVDDGATGFLVEPGDIDAAAGAVKRAHEIDRAACRHFAEQQLDLEQSLDAHEELYKCA